MPLKQSSSKEAFSKNVSAEMRAGKPQKQALAIAYATKHRNMHKGGSVNPELREAGPEDKRPSLDEVDASRSAAERQHKHSAECYSEGGEVTCGYHGYDEDPSIDSDVETINDGEYQVPNLEGDEFARGGLIDRIMDKRHPKQADESFEEAPEDADLKELYADEHEDEPKKGILERLLARVRDSRKKVK